MSWLDNLKYVLGGDDTSPKLEKGQIESLFKEEMQKVLPDFYFFSYEKDHYTFQRVRKLGTFDLYEAFHIFCSPGSFECSISSKLNQDLIKHNSEYNTGFINPHITLIALKKAGPITTNETYYFHNGRTMRTTKVIQQIVKDYTEYGIPFFNRYLNDLNKNVFVKKGIEYFTELGPVDKKEIKIQIELQLAEGEHLLSNVTHPFYINLVEKLQEIKDQPREIRQQAPRIAFDLTQLYLSDQIAL